MINEKQLFEQPVKNNILKYEKIKNTANGHGDDYTAGCLLNSAYFRDVYKMIAIDLSKTQALDANPKATQQINFTANLDRVGNTRIKNLFHS